MPMNTPEMIVIMMILLILVVGGLLVAVRVTGSRMVRKAPATTGGDRRPKGTSGKVTRRPDEVHEHI